MKLTTETIENFLDETASAARSARMEAECLCA